MRATELNAQDARSDGRQRSFRAGVDGAPSPGRRRCDTGGVNDASEIQRVAGEMLQEVLRRAHLVSAPELAAVVAEEALTIGAQPLVLYLLDREQKLLVPVPGHGAGER